MYTSVVFVRKTQVIIWNLVSNYIDYEIGPCTM